MATSTVYVKTISAFDSTKDQTITFGYSGTQCTKNKIVVYENSTSTIVYEHTVTSFTLAHTIPANTLTNGNTYYCKITAYYTISNVEYSVTSSASNVFKCLTAATWGFGNLSSGDVIGNSYFTFQMNYSQAQSELVNEYYIVVYTMSGTIFWTSGALYDATAYTTISGLPNNSVYYVRAYGTTKNGLCLDTRNSITGVDISVTIDYVTPALYSIATLENNKYKGWVKVSTQVAAIKGKSDSTIVYIDNKYVDLTSGTVVTFDNGYELGNIFTLEGAAYDITPNTPFILIPQMNMVLTFRQATFSSGEKFYAELKSASYNFVLYSNLMTIPKETDLIFFWIQKNGSLFNLKIENKGEIA